MKKQTEVKLCEKLAKIAHYGQFRNDGVTPYIVHPKAVANSLKDAKMKAVAWLHDVIEDCNVTRKQLANEGVSEDVLNAVVIMTRAKDEDYLKYILRCKQNYLACNVKIADIKHNMSTLNRKKHKDKWTKYQLALHILQN